jgi:hypothetical protein
MSADERKRKKRCSFTPDEDDRLRELVEKYGTHDWTRVASKIRRRDPRQCRERWTNYLSPSVINGPWTVEEDELLAEKVAEFGRKWQHVAGFFQGRTDINVKNHWNHLQKLRGIPSPAKLLAADHEFEQIIASLLRESPPDCTFTGSSEEFYF